MAAPSKRTRVAPVLRYWVGVVAGLSSTASPVCSMKPVNVKHCGNQSFQAQTDQNHTIMMVCTCWLACVSNQ